MTLAVLAAALVAAPLAGLASTPGVRRLAGGAATPVWLLPAIDLALAGTTVAVTTEPVEAALALALGWSLAALACIDGLVLRLPDLLTLPLIALGLGLGAWRCGDPWRDHLIGAVAGYAVLAGLGWAYERLRRRPGLGLGDAKLLAAAGTWLGWSALPDVLLIACAGGFAWVGVRLLRHGRSALAGALPFGPPLCAALWIVWMQRVALRA
jgi:leader peptidase (prepilin peptidase)/N-methyltransferase